MKIYINIIIIVLLAIKISCLFILMKDDVNIFGFGFLVGVISICIIYFLRKNIIYETRNRKFSKE